MFVPLGAGGLSVNNKILTSSIYKNAYSNVKDERCRTIFMLCIVAMF